MSIKSSIAAMLVLALTALALPAVAAGRSDADFVKACTAHSNLSQAICECSARKARSDLTPDGFALLVALVEGNEPVAAQLRSTLPFEQVMKAGTFMLRGPAACAKEGPAAG